jgi:predicted DNA-binding transcriptional regulator AlpA
MIPGKYIAGHYEVAVMLGLSKQNLSNWRHRKADFPQPFQVLAMTPLWDRRVIHAWAKSHNLVVQDP